VIEGEVDGGGAVRVRAHIVADAYRVVGYRCDGRVDRDREKTAGKRQRHQLQQLKPVPRTEHPHLHRRLGNCRTRNWNRAVACTMRPRYDVAATSLRSPAINERYDQVTNSLGLSQLVSISRTLSCVSPRLSCRARLIRRRTDHVVPTTQVSNAHSLSVPPFSVSINVSGVVAVHTPPVGRLN